MLRPHERQKWAACVLAAFCVTAAGCGSGKPQRALAAGPAEAVAAAKPSQPEIRITGTVEAVRFFTVQVPQITGQQSRLTLTRIAASGARVNAGDILAEFDSTQQLDNAREAQAKFDDLAHQVEQRRAQNRADAAKRMADLHKAEADLAKAQLQLRKGPLLAEIDRLKAEVKLEDARAHVGSLKESNSAHDRADAAAVRILELQRDRQKVSVDRSLRNAQRLQIKAPLAGMVALENVWRNNSMGHAQEGDQLWPGQPLIRIFDPLEMEIRGMVNEPDRAALRPGCPVSIRLDAYPEMVFPGRFVAASPAAASALGSPIKNFLARFRLETTDPRLLPDLSAAVTVSPAGDTP